MTACPSGHQAGAGIQDREKCPVPGNWARYTTNQYVPPYDQRPSILGVGLAFTSLRLPSARITCHTPTWPSPFMSALRIRVKVVERLTVQRPLQRVVVAPHDVDVRGIARAFFHQVLRLCGGAAATSPLLGDFFCSATARLQVICRRTLLSPDFYMLPREGSENTTTHLGEGGVRELIALARRQTANPLQCRDLCRNMPVARANSSQAWRPSDLQLSSIMQV